MEERTHRPDKTRTPMAIPDRAKQFAPFASLGSMEKLLRDVAEGRDVGDLEHLDLFEEAEYLLDP